MAPNPAIKGLRCLKCGQSYPLGEYFEGCSACRTDATISNLTVVYDYAMLKRKLNRETFTNRNQQDLDNVGKSYYQKGENKSPQSSPLYCVISATS